MKKFFINSLTGLMLAFALSVATVSAATTSKVMVLDFQLNDLTDLPNAPDELKRISYLSSQYKANLDQQGVTMIPVADKLQQDIRNQSPTYLFDHIEYVADVGAENGADYVIINVALKPTYLFVYPRVLLVDTKQKKVVMSKAFQLESSWSDQNTTANTARKIADVVSSTIKGFEAKK